MSSVRFNAGVFYLLVPKPSLNQASIFDRSAVLLKTWSNLFFVFLGLIFIVSCGQGKIGKDESYFQMKSLKGDFGAYGGLSYVEGFAFEDGFLYVPDAEGHRVLKMTPQLEVVKIIGSFGEGPGELNVAGRIWVNQGRLFVRSALTQSLITYDLEGNYLDTTPLARFPTYSNFVVYDEFLFISTPIAESAITVLGLDGEPLQEFGKHLINGTFEQRRARNSKILALAELDQPLVIAVGMTEPVIDVFHLDGSHLYTEHLNRSPHLTALLEASKAFYERAENNNKSQMLFFDISVSGNKLYLLPATMEPPHRVLCYEIYQDRLEFHSYKQLNDQVMFNALVVVPEQGTYLYDGASHQIGLFE